MQEDKSRTDKTENDAVLT